LTKHFLAQVLALVDGLLQHHQLQRGFYQSKVQPVQLQQQPQIGYRGIALLLTKEAPEGYARHKKEGSKEIVSLDRRAAPLRSIVPSVSSKEENHNGK